MPAEKIKRLRREDGIALPVVIMGVVAIALLSFLVQQLAVSQTTQSNFYASEDAVLAAGEAMLERYAAKLTIDPLYYQSYVDEAEAPRRCADAASPDYGTVVGPGSPWLTTCATWTYEFTNTFYQHPLLAGETGTFDDVGVIMHVEPPTGTERLSVELVAKQAERPAQRALETEIGPESVSEFLWLVEGDLFFGPDDRTMGKVYAGGIVGYESGGEAHDNVYAEDVIAVDLKIGPTTYDPPLWMNGAEGWDSTGNFNLLGEVITDVYPDPVDFDGFWDDLDLVIRAACGGGGICLDAALNPAIPATAVGYLVETTAGGTRLQISYATEVPWDNSCNRPIGPDKEHLARWTQASQDATWIPLGVFDIPRNGALWANEIVVVGRNEATPFTLDGALTIYTGTSSARNDIIIGSDLLYANGLNGNDLLALIASSEIWINPNSLGSDGAVTIYASTLSQSGSLHLAQRCLDSGNCTTPAGATVTSYGSNAAIGTGNLVACVATDYNFDPRLEILRPPLFPLLDSTWVFSNWRETTQPCWLESGGCP